MIIEYDRQMPRSERVNFDKRKGLGKRLMEAWYCTIESVVLEGIT